MNNDFEVAIITVNNFMKMITYYIIMIMIIVV